MDSQQLTHNAHGAVSSDVFQPPFYPSFPEVLDSSKVTQAPHSSPSYVHQQYAPDSGASLEGGRSPPLPFDIHEQPSQQGHRHFDPSPRPQQYQPSPSVAHPVFPHDHEGPYPTHQGLSHQLSRTPAHSAPMPISPWEINAFSENSGAQSTALRGGISPISPIYGATYVLRPQPVYHPPPTYRSAPIHAPPELSQPTTTPGPSTLREQQDGAVTDQGKRSRSWGGVGSLDPATGVFSPASDHPRMRTAQACEKCRARKAKCSGDHPACQRCLERGLECKYAAERRMRGPNKPKPPLPSMPDRSPQPAVVEGQKTRKRASTMPTVQRRGLQIWSPGQQQQKQKQSQQQLEQAVIAAAAAAAASPAPSASSAGSGSLGYPPLSESEASPMTPHSSLDSRHSTGVCFPASPRVFVQDFASNARPGVLNHISESNIYGEGDDHDGSVATEGMIAGVGSYGQDVFPDLSMRLSFENPKTF